MTRKVKALHADLNHYFIDLACHSADKSVSRNFHISTSHVRRKSADFPVVNPVVAVSDLFQATLPENQCHVTGSAFSSHELTDQI
jgi:hypothetical protein